MNFLSSITSQLRTYKPFNNAEAIMVRQTLQFIERNPDCLHRTSLVGHLTASAWIVDKERRAEVLLVEHRKLKAWVQPGGHADGTEDLLKVAHQEALEETGIEVIDPIGDGIFDIDVHTVRAYQDIPAHLHFDFRYMMAASRKSSVLLSEESTGLAWVSVDDVRDYNATPTIDRMVEKTRLLFAR